MQQKTKTLQFQGAAFVLALTLFVAGFVVPITIAENLAIGTNTLGNGTLSQTSSHSIQFTTKTDLATDDRIELYFPDFILNLTDISQIGIVVGPNNPSLAYDNTEKTIILTLTEPFPAGNLDINIADGKITNPSLAGEFSITILTRKASSYYAVVDSGIALAKIASSLNVEIVVVDGGGGSKNDFETFPPILTAIQIQDTNGTTNDPTPPIKITAAQTPTFAALSCDGGMSWSDWINYPGDDELNTGSDQNFNITTGAGCTSSTGTKTITMRLRNAYNQISEYRQDSTIYQTDEDDKDDEIVVPENPEPLDLVPDGPDPWTPNPDDPWSPNLPDNPLNPPVNIVSSDTIVDYNEYNDPLYPAAPIAPVSPSEITEDNKLNLEENYPSDESGQDIIDETKTPDLSNKEEAKHQSYIYNAFNIEEGFTREAILLIILLILLLVIVKFILKHIREKRKQAVVLSQKIKGRINQTKTSLKLIK